ncbi:TPA: ribonuclease P protein component [Candidatus Uhrbacteria bacterium]|uniref:Ribonuclease P protein component n=1 Tax=Candidatus Uhrbacteria bacterium GW2011_GWC2_53_7 TaxID=1618986 RepID=A0A0G2AW00_9BACT|nr:MAG: Ribonuclease P protein component [Candidatus Uhrbacteria bacterium GW2011_GWC2_53_7]OGL72668.1 MAG: ribonuclease P protein component [Candidatus Uhrbacteria bacterium RIFCSPHIGHO2_02_FULL_54_11]HBL39968.1 ribonuclease P protein component [Candidatus Uhrbacteria bacterium]
MLPKEHRLRRDRDFDRVFKEGEKTFVSPYSVRFVGNHLALSRFAVVVGSRVSKKAVERNRVRRQVREIIRLLLPEISPGKDVSVSVQPQAKALPYKKLEEALERALKKAKLLA